VTGHSRAAPLLWLIVWKEEIATRRNDFEDSCLRRLAEIALIKLSRDDPGRPQLRRPEAVRLADAAVNPLAFVDGVTATLRLLGVIFKSTLTSWRKRQHGGP